jgi:hypothetical protein
MESSMHSDELIERSPMRAVSASVGGGLELGQVGAVLARAGIGKSAFLVHVALHALLREGRVLHVSLSSPQEHVRSFYDEIFNAVASRLGARERATLAVTIERHRVIHSCLGRAFTPADLERLTETLANVMDFRPDLVVIDGFEGTDVDLSGWAEVAAKSGTRVWVALRTHRDTGQAVYELVSDWSTVVALSPSGSDVALRVMRRNGEAQTEGPALHLDPVTMLLRPEDVNDPATTPPTPLAHSCTLYSGGADGAEACFGEHAERWGLREVTLAVDGQTGRRARGRRVLTEAELLQGDVSFKYVKNRLKRNWTDEGLRRVLQVQWHLVSRAQQVFIIGRIQPDDTVHGGTGWAVELAKRWHKAVWVFDQDRDGWFTWMGNAWVPGKPLIETPLFAGTGTMHLDENGRRAIDELFARSFGARAVA